MDTIVDILNLSRFFYLSILRILYFIVFRIGKDSNILLSSVDILLFALFLFSIRQLYFIIYR